MKAVAGCDAQLDDTLLSKLTETETGTVVFTVLGKVGTPDEKCPRPRNVKWSSCPETNGVGSPRRYEPKTFRDFNEAHHRVYAQLSPLLTQDEGVFPPDVLVLCLSVKDVTTLFVK